MLKEYTQEDMEVMKAVGKKIRQLRKESGMSQFQLSIDADLTKNQIGRIERAERNTSLVALNRIADLVEGQLLCLYLEYRPIGNSHLLRGIIPQITLGLDNGTQFGETQ